MLEEEVASLNQYWPPPKRPRPIAIIGAGGIVNDAHLPAYTMAGFPVDGIFDIDRSRSTALVDKFGLDRVYDSVEQAAGRDGVIFDVAVPPQNTASVLEALPDGAVVLIQKPMGMDLDGARRIRDLCRQKNLTAAVNFQLRFSPMMLALRDAMDRGLIGQIVDLEFRLSLRTPWELFPFLKQLPRVEILVHSVHYLDLARHFLGEPRGVYARTVQHPAFQEFESTKSSAILDYGSHVRCVLSVNHHFQFGPRHEGATVTLQGLKGAAVATLGLLLNYPRGKPETLEIVTEGSDWAQVPLCGRWFPEAFVGIMSNVQRFAAGEDPRLITSVEDAFHTMALVEACYESDARGGVRPATE